MRSPPEGQYSPQPAETKHVAQPCAKQEDAGNGEQTMQRAAMAKYAPNNSSGNAGNQAAGVCDRRAGVVEIRRHGAPDRERAARYEDERSRQGLAAVQEWRPNRSPRGAQRMAGQ